ncbi:MAG: PilZ domain-containing protein [candidate division WOR-3 bacterium]
MSCLWQNVERRAFSRFPLNTPIYLKLDSGQIIIGTTLNINYNGLSAEIPKEIIKGSLTNFNFFYGKISIRGYGRVVWSESREEKNLCGIIFIEIKQKDRSHLNELLNTIVSPICQVCHSKIDIDKIAPYIKKGFQRESQNYDDVRPFIKIIHMLNSNFQWAILIEKILDVIKDHLRGHQARLFLYNKSNGFFELWGGERVESKNQFSVIEEKDPYNELFKEGKITIIPWESQRFPFLNKEESKPLKGVSLILVPIMSQGKLLGILSVETVLPVEKKTLMKEEEEILAAYANLILVGLKMFRSQI